MNVLHLKLRAFGQIFRCLGEPVSDRADAFEINGVKFFYEMLTRHGTASLGETVNLCEGWVSLALETAFDRSNSKKG